MIGLDYPPNNNLRPTAFNVGFTIGTTRFQVQLNNKQGVTIPDATLAAITAAVS